MAPPSSLPALGVRWLTLSQRLGVGGAVRAGIRYAQRAGYTYVVRVDGDGQHRACDIAAALAPVARDEPTSRSARVSCAAVPIAAGQDD